MIFNGSNNFSAVIRALSGALMLTLIGCSTLGPEEPHSVGYKYFTLIRDSSGHYRNADILGPGETFVYSYGFRRKDLIAIDQDLSVASKKFIEQRHGVPPECTNGIKVISTGLGENGGASANVECN
jgi:hypothetical protein